MGRKLYQNFYEEFPRTTKVVSVPIFSLRKPPIITIFFIWVWLLLENVNIINSHCLYGVISSSLAKLLSLGTYKNIWFVYDKEQIDTINRSNLLKIIIRLLMKFNAIDLVLVLDDNMKDYVKKHLKTEKVITIRVGIHPNIINNYYSISCKNIDGSSLEQQQVIKIFFHGILRPRRRLEDLIIALAKVKERLTEDIVLYVSGSLNFCPDYVSYVKRLTEKLGLSGNVVFLGEITDVELSRMYKCTDIFVWPCYEQTWGLAPLEAMSFGKPVIISKGAGVSEVLNDQVAVFIPPKNPQALADALIRLIKEERFRRFLGENARKYVINNFTYRNTGKSLEYVFSKILNC